MYILFDPTNLKEHHKYCKKIYNLLLGHKLLGHKELMV